MNLQDYIIQLSNDNLIYFALPLFTISIILEFYSNRKNYYGKDTLVSLLMMIFSAIIEFIPKIIAFICFTYLYQISPLKDILVRQWWVWLLLLFADDFSYYWFHRLNHEVRIFWAGHVPHHSSVYMNFGTELRQGVGERIHNFFFLDVDCFFRYRPFNDFYYDVI